MIDVPDRVEFIQMLGRIRINKEKELNHINLYLRDFDLENLKKAGGIMLKNWNCAGIMKSMV